MDNLRVLNSEGRRYNRRVSVDLSAIIDVLHLRMRCNLENLSTSGAKCNVSKTAPLMVGSKVCLFFRLAGQARFFILNGRVIFISPSRSDMDRNEVGVRFIDINPEVYRQLEDWINKKCHENHENRENIEQFM